MTDPTVSGSRISGVSDPTDHSTRRSSRTVPTPLIGQQAQHPSGRPDSPGSYRTGGSGGSGRPDSGSYRAGSYQGRTDVGKKTVSSAHTTTPPVLPSHPIIPSHSRPAPSKPSALPPQITVTGGAVRPLNSPTYSGNIGGGPYPLGRATLDSPTYSSGGSGTDEVLGQATSFGTKAKCLYGHSFEFDVDKQRPIPKALPAQSASPLATYGNEATPPNPKDVPGGDDGSSKCPVSSFSSQSSSGADGYSTQESGEHDEDGNKMLLHNSVGVDAKRAGRAKGGATDVWKNAGDVEKRPLERQESTGKQKHRILAIGCSRAANSLGQVTSDRETAESAGGVVYTDQLEGSIDGPREQEAVRRSQTAGGRTLGGGVGVGGATQQEEYTQLRVVNTELQRLHSIEEHEKRAQQELIQCKQEKSEYEGQVMELTKRLSLFEGKVGERSSRASGVSGQLEAEVIRLQLEVRKKDETIAKQNRQLSKLGSVAGNLTAMMTYSEKTSLAIKTLTEKNEQLEEENAMLAESRDAISGDVAELEVEMKRLREEEVNHGSSELAEANKQVQVLQEQLDEQQRVCERQERLGKRVGENYQKATESIHHFEQQVVLQQGMLQNKEQDLLNSQQVASDLSSQLEGLKVEMDKLNRLNQELYGELEAQKINAVTFQEDFNEERKDREKAHSKMADMETQYKQQFGKLGEELLVSRQHGENLERQLKEMERHYQAQVSQSRYVTGDKDRAISALQADKKKLEDELSSKMQQVKQYKKQADHLSTELTTFSDAHGIQKSQIEMMGVEIDKLTKEVKKLEHDNRNLLAKDRHVLATGGRVGGVASTEKEQRRVMDLESLVEGLQTENAILVSQVDQYQKQAKPHPSQPPPPISSSSRLSALPDKRSHVGQQGKSSSVDSLPPRTRQGLSSAPSRPPPTYSDHSKLLSLRGGTYHTASHTPSDLSRASRDAYVSTHNATNASPHPFHTSGNASSAGSTTNASHHTVGVASRPPHPQNYNIGGGRTYQYAGGVAGGVVRPDYMHRQHYTSSGPSSLPSPEHQNDPHRGPYGQASLHSHDDMDLRGGSEIVEKDSPPTSFVSSPGPSSLTPQQFSVPSNPRRNHSQQISRPGQGGGVARYDHEGNGFMARHNQGTSAPDLLPFGSAGRVGSKPGQNRNVGSRTGLTNTSDSKMGLRTQPGNYPLPATAIPTSGHAPPRSTGHTVPTDNQLEVGIDQDIVVAAADVKTQGKGAGQETEDAPFDPNLECPTCGCRFKIGQIQLFRQHAASCNNKRV